MNMRYKKIEPSLLNSLKHSMCIKELKQENNKILIDIVCRFLFNSELALESVNTLVLENGKRPTIVDFKDENCTALVWTKTDSSLCEVVLEQKDINVLISAWNKINPKWKIRRTDFVSPFTLSTYINVLENIIKYPNLSLLPSELGWVKCLSVPIKNDVLYNSQKKINAEKTNLIEILNWPSGFIKIIKECKLDIINAERAYLLYSVGMNNNFIKDFMKLLLGVSNNRKSIELVTEIYSLHEDKKVIQNRILSAFKDADYYDYLTMFKDYLRMAKDLEIQIKTKEIARGGEKIIERGSRTSKMKMYHDNMAREFSLAKDSVLTKKFIRVIDAYKPHVEYPLQIEDTENVKTENAPENLELKNKYFFQLPVTPFDLEEEGRYLGHCVGSYSKRVAEDTCLIVLMRSVEKEREPLLTIELYNSDNKIKINQIQGKSRRPPTETEQVEINKWIQYLNSNNFKIQNYVEYERLNKINKETQEVKKSKY